MHLAPAHLILFSFQVQAPIAGFCDPFLGFASFHGQAASCALGIECLEPLAGLEWKPLLSGRKEEVPGEAGGSSQFLESRIKSEVGSVESYGLEPLGPGKALRPPLLTSLL